MPAPIPSAAGSPPARMTSLDALRGFDLFWISGADTLGHAALAFAGGAFTKAVAEQLEHCEWVGFHFYDLIFPLFVFIAGVSLVFSARKSVQKAGRAAAVRRLLSRGLLLYLVGVFYSGGLSDGLDGVRWLGVLNRIALASTAAGLLNLFLPVRGLIAATAAILLGYWGMMRSVPYPAFRLEKGAVAEAMARSGETNLVRLYQSTTARTSGHFEPGYNLANHVDFQFLPGRLYDTYYDPEGILSTLPAVATCLLGVLAGHLLASAAGARRTGHLAVIGLGCLAAGFLWSPAFPIVKKLWSSSFVLVAGGFSFLLLAAFHEIVDLRGWRRWCQPFLWIGSNAITIYLLASIMGYSKIAGRFLSPDIRASMGPWGEVVLALGSLLVMFLFARALHRRGLFLRL